MYEVLDAGYRSVLVVFKTHVVTAVALSHICLP